MLLVIKLTRADDFHHLLDIDDAFRGRLRRNRANLHYLDPVQRQSPSLVLPQLRPHQVSHGNVLHSGVDIGKVFASMTHTVISATRDGEDKDAGQGCSTHCATCKGTKQRCMSETNDRVHIKNTPAQRILSDLDRVRRVW